LEASVGSDNASIAKLRQRQANVGKENKSQQIKKPSKRRKTVSPIVRRLFVDEDELLSSVQVSCFFTRMLT
jgi:hypothetical protein